jgi:hypothetical protein
MVHGFSPELRERCAETPIDDIPCSNVKVLHYPKDAPLAFSAISPWRCGPQ